MNDESALKNSGRLIAVGACLGVLIGAIGSAFVVAESGDWFMLLSVMPDLAAAYGLMGGMLGGVYSMCLDSAHE